MNHLWRAASESAVVDAALMLALGMAAIVATAWLLERWTANPLGRRMLWRAAIVAGGLWASAEVLGGSLLLARWLAEPRLPAAASQAAAEDRKVMPEPAPEDAAVVNLPSQWQADSHSEIEPAEVRFAFVEEPPTDEIAWRPLVVATPPAIEGLQEPLPSTDIADNGVHAAETVPVAARPADSAGRRVTPAASTANLVGLGWVAGCGAVGVWFLGRRVIVWWYTWRYTMPAEDRVVQEALDAARLLGPSAKARAEGPTASWRYRVVESDRLSAPVVYGIVRPTLAVPADFIESLPAAQRQAVLVHELVHIAGRDPLWQMAYDLLATLLWWHPLVWLGRSRHRTACEAAADSGAAAIEGGGRALAAALIRLGRRMTSEPRLGWAAIDRRGRRRSPLGRRVARLLSDRTPCQPLRGGRRGAVILCGVTGGLIPLFIIGTALARSVVSESSVPIGENSMTIWQTSWRGSLAAAALAAMISSSPADAAGQVEVELVLATEEEEEEVVDDASGESVAESIQKAVVKETEKADDLAAAEGNPDVLSKLARAKRQALTQAQEQRALAMEQFAKAQAEQAARLQKEMAKLQENFARERAQLDRQMQKMLEQAKNAAAKGRPEAARQIMERMERMGAVPGLPADVLMFKAEAPMNEAQRRIHHLHQAAENLVAIGKNEMAEELMREARGLEQSQAEAGETARRATIRLQPRGTWTVPDKPHDPLELAETVQGFEFRLAEDEQRERRGDVEELHAEMNELREQMNDMRGLLEKVVNRMEEGEEEEEEEETRSIR